MIIVTSLKVDQMLKWDDENSHNANTNSHHALTKDSAAQNPNKPPDLVLIVKIVQTIQQMQCERQNNNVKGLYIQTVQWYCQVSPKHLQ